MRSIVLICALCMTLTLSGCHGPSLQGKWVAADTAREAFTFTDKAFTLYGTYNLDGDKLTLHGQSIKIKAAHPTDQTKVDAGLAANQQRLLANFDSINPRKVLWWKQDEVKFTTPDGKETLYDKVKN